MMVFAFYTVYFIPGFCGYSFVQFVVSLMTTFLI